VPRTAPAGSHVPVGAVCIFNVFNDFEPNDLDGYDLNFKDTSYLGFTIYKPGRGFASIFHFFVFAAAPFAAHENWEYLNVKEQWISHTL
jgi:hypothetical protein